jgi:hypothetical protein
LPLHGGFSATVNRSDVDSNFLGYSYNGTIDTYTGSAAFQPTQKFHFSVSTDYSDNLSGSLYQAITSTGGIVTPPAQGESSHAFDLLGNASYSVMRTCRRWPRRIIANNSSRAKATEPTLTAAASPMAGLCLAAISTLPLPSRKTPVSTSSANELGFSGTVNYNKRFDGWTAGVFANYAQNVQTLLITYTSSFYGYGGNIRRRWGRFGWTAGASFNKTGLTEQAGTSASSQSYNSSVSYSPWINVNAGYSKSNGNGIETGAGLAATPTPQPILTPNDLILFGGNQAIRLA